jgi:hypothetical protein
MADEIQPVASPPTPFTVASGPMSPHVTVREVPDGVELTVRGTALVLPTTMALRLAHQLLSVSLGDRHHA